MQQERDMSIATPMERELRVQPDIDNMRWRNRRYDYFCGDWRYDWHKEHKEVLVFDEIRQRLGTDN